MILRRILWALGSWFEATEARRGDGGDKYPRPPVPLDQTFGSSSSPASPSPVSAQQSLVFQPDVSRHPQPCASPSPRSPRRSSSPTAPPPSRASSAARTAPTPTSLPTRALPRALPRRSRTVSATPSQLGGHQRVETDPANSDDLRVEAPPPHAPPDQVRPSPRRRHLPVGRLWH